MQTVQHSQSQQTANILITPNLSEVLIRPDFCLNGLILLGWLDDRLRSVDPRERLNLEDDHFLDCLSQLFPRFPACSTPLSATPSDKTSFKSLCSF